MKNNFCFEIKNITKTEKSISQGLVTRYEQGNLTVEIKMVTWLRLI